MHPPAGRSTEKITYRWTSESNHGGGNIFRGHTAPCGNVSIRGEHILERWEEQRRKAIERFLSGWDWEMVYRTWHSRIRGYPVTLEPLFTEIRVHDPAYPVGRKEVLSWCPEKKINNFQLDLQRHYDNHPGTNGPTNPCECRQGELITLNYLWAHKDNIEIIAAALINASLFTRMHSSRGHYPLDYWPRHYCVEALDRLAAKVWDNGGDYPHWQHYHTKVLPDKKWDYVYKIDDIHGIVSFLAEEHALVLLNYRPVSIVFKEKRDPFVEKILNDESKLKRKHLRELKESQRVKSIIDSQENRNRQQANDKWKNITRVELERLVWTKPTVLLAKELGVSDVAIAKRCKSLGISKPKPGFWAKVNAGLIPHPNGKPLRE